MGGGVLVGVLVGVIVGNGVFVGLGVREGSLAGVGEEYSALVSGVNVAGTVTTGRVCTGAKVGEAVIVGAVMARVGSQMTSGSQPATVRQARRRINMPGINCFRSATGLLDFMTSDSSV